MKLTSLVGPTAAGKTAFTLELAHKIVTETRYEGVDLISADSRQVYQGLEITSGADVPDGFKTRCVAQLRYPFFSKDKIHLHGVSIISPAAEWSVTHFQDLAHEVMQFAEKHNHAVILIGGTGLYHDQITNSDPALRVKPNSVVRKKAEAMSISDLQKWAQKVNPTRFEQLNHSDVNNPRRLVRVIEIGLAAPAPSPFFQTKIQQRYVGLQRDLETLEERIKQRVKLRFETGAVTEVKKLRSQKNKTLSSSASTPSTWPALSSLGVKEINNYLDGVLSKEELFDMWSLHELQYARRQFTWWKKRQVKWFEVGKAGEYHKAGWKETAFAYILDP